MKGKPKGAGRPCAGLGLGLTATVGHTSACSYHLHHAYTRLARRLARVALAASYSMVQLRAVPMNRLQP